MAGLVALSLGAWSKQLGPTGGAPQRQEATPKALEGVGVDEQLGAQLPLDMVMQDSLGRSLPLSAIIDGRRPTILTFNYSSCPMLCSLQLDGMVDGLRDVPWTVGKNFNIMTVSIDPAESQERSALFKQKYLDQYRREGAPEVAGGWFFLRGRELDVERLARLVGFHYKFVPEQNEWAHAAVTMVLTPEGRVSRYLYGVLYPPRDLRLALTEAAEGKQVSTLEQILLFCFHYDAAAGRYAPMATNIMRLGGAVTVLAMSSMLALFWRRDRRRQPTHA